jgi:hypothetical protein
MDGTGPLATPNDLYTRLGTASAPMLVDLRRQFAFKAGGQLIIGASYILPEALNVAWNTIAARVEQLMDSLGRTSPTFE